MAASGWLTLEIAVWLVPFVTLAIGLLIGYLAQRSGFCSIGGFRDLLLFRQTRLFVGYLVLIGSAFLFYALFAFLLPSAFPNFFKTVPIAGAPAGLQIGGYIVLAVIGGFGMGFLGVLLGGCPLRQMIMGSEGNLRSVFFIIGLAIGAVIFHMFVSGWVVAGLKAIGL